MELFNLIYLIIPVVFYMLSSVTKAYELFSFTIVGIVITLILPVSLILSWMILKEKLSLKSIVSIVIITLSIIAVKFFEN